MKVVNLIASILLVIGGINWGFIGVMDTNLVELVVGDGNLISQVIYSLVGLSAILHAVKGKIFEID